MSQEENDSQGRRALIGVTVLMGLAECLKVALWALRDDGRAWPNLTSIAINMLFAYYMWEGKTWARLATIAYYSLAFVFWLIILGLGWWASGLPVRMIGVTCLLLSAAVSLMLGLNRSLIDYQQKLTPL